MSGGGGSGGGSTVLVSRIPPTVNAQDLFDLFDDDVSPVYACKIYSSYANWKSQGSGLVQFDSSVAAENACRLLAEEKLKPGRLKPFSRAQLDVRPSPKDIVPRAAIPEHRLIGVVLHVGILSGEKQMEVVDSWGGVRVEIMPERKKMELFVEEGREHYKLEVMFGDIDFSYGCRLGGGGNGTGILLQLRSAPRIYHRIHGPVSNSKFICFRFHSCKEDFNFRWIRSTDFSSNNAFGKSSYLCLNLAEELPNLEVLEKLPCYGQLGDLNLAKAGLLCYSSKLFPVISSPSNCKVEYEVLFQLNSLVHMQKISSAQVNSHLFDILSKPSLDVTIKILTKMHNLKTTCYDPVSFIQDSIRKNQFSGKKTIDAKNVMSCHRAFVTPTKVYFLGPELEKTNYIVNYYSAYAHDFLRITFVEEDWTRLSSNAVSIRIHQGLFSKPTRTQIYDRIVSILRDGITIGTKKFEFLAFSASQLRSNSVWMFASNGEVTAESIREWMGQFNKIRSVSKCAARMGQQFSSSQQTLEVSPKDVKVIPDVEVTSDCINYCFSDGIGKISLPFATKVSQECRLDHTPSAFQIRYGGYKGVIAVDGTLFWKLSLRPSMLKFNSKNTMLNITSWSKYLPCFLNREIICLLSTLGIEDAVFEYMQHEEIQHLDKMLTTREVALTLLDRFSGAETRIAANMLRIGYEPNREPYLFMMLKAYQEYMLSDIRSKSRIFVPKGRVLIGCLDETCTLSYGQVYVRVSMTQGELHEKGQTCFERIDQTAVIVGKVVVTKNPCLHPGDIRVLQAVYEPTLIRTGLVDCIIFPQKGKRPHPNECSGGDLDGDLYFICWDEKLIPSETYTPMDYIPRRPRLTDHEVTLEEMQKFFVEYMINDTLGAISTAHLVCADRAKKKAQSEECLQLAKLHSMAVDFAKTGAPAEMPKALKPRECPDFMERYDRPTYTSTGVLGKLYRAVVSHMEQQQGSSFICSEAHQPLAYDYDLEVEGFEAFLEDAVKFYGEYAEKLSSLMNFYGAKQEVEILTGNLRSCAIYLQRDKNRYAETKERILIAVKSLHREFEGSLKSSCSGSDIPRMASACYHVTYHPDYWSEATFLSFPWILSCELLAIKVSKAQKA